jgi:hypothetical protein
MIKSWIANVEANYTINHDDDDGNEDNGGNLPLPKPLPQPC